MIVTLVDPAVAAKKARLRKLLALRFQVDAELATLRRELRGAREPYGPRGDVKHGTEEGYQWHRYRHRKHGEG
jgi:hypothetical protein